MLLKGTDQCVSTSLSVFLFTRDSTFECVYDLTRDRTCCALITITLVLHRDNGVKAIENLMEKKGKFDYILLETTGLADPGPIAGLFWLDDALSCEIQLDGIVTVVDAVNCLAQISQPGRPEMIHRQP